MRRLRVDTAPSYEVVIGEGALRELVSAPGRTAVVVDENVERLHGKHVRELLAPHRPEYFVLPSGERHKTLRTAEALYDWLGAIRLERGERLLALGGGVCGDLTGFIAATWRRGIAFLQVPTTLLSQVDSSVGGKVGVDLPHGKNLVGAFLQPTQVLADTSLLRTLPEREMWCGLAEIVKTALLSGGELFELVDAHLEELAKNRGPLEDVIAACVAFKAAVVKRDPEERGERAILNLGHTYGHALEAAAGFERLLHGEAVAWGLRAALVLSGFPAESRAMRLVERLPAPSLAGLDRTAILNAMASDKKSAGGVPTFVLLDDVGRARWGCKIAGPRIHEVLDDLLARGAR